MKAIDERKKDLQELEKERERACGDWLDVFYIEREGTAPGGRPSGTFKSPRAGVND